jgi:hypothetical protein
MYKTIYSRRIKQFKYLSLRINEKLSDGTWQGLSAPEQGKMIRKLRYLFGLVKNFLGAKELKKVLAAAAVFLCITTAGAQTFAPPVANPFSIALQDSIIVPAFADIDNDGDQDLFVYAGYGNIYYFQNTGTPTAPAFAAPLLNPFSLVVKPSAYKPDFADLDGDGDLDMLMGEYYGILRYYQNTGTPTAPSFAIGVPNPFGLDSTNEVALPAFADLDHDGDLDLLVSAYYGALTYFQNIGTATVPNFATQVQVPYGLDSTNGAGCPDFADLDNDGDLDLLVGGYYYFGFAYFANAGTITVPSFSPQVIDPFGLSGLCDWTFSACVDIDGDGDIDVFSGNEYCHKQLYFFENTMLPSGISADQKETRFEVFPVPANDLLNIKCSDQQGTQEFRIMDGIGKVVIKSKLINGRSAIQTSELSPGIYILEINDSGKMVRKKLIIQ